MSEEAKGKYVLVINFGGNPGRAKALEASPQPPELFLRQPDPGCPKCKASGNIVLATIVDRSASTAKQIDATQVIESNVYKFNEPECARDWADRNEHLFDLVLVLDDAPDHP